MRPISAKRLKWMAQAACLASGFFVAAPGACFAIGQEKYVENEKHAGDFALVRGGAAATICVDGGDYPGVRRAATDLQADVARVSEVKPGLAEESGCTASRAILIGTIGKSGLIDRVIRENKLDVSAIRGKWESFLIQVVEHPIAGVESALVIAGSDKRGTIFGIYDLSEQMGVSPWYWWADVPVQHRDAVFVKPGRYVQGEPAVKYRGIFLNDEAPALTGWVKEKYGSYNREFYMKVFELLLRLKGNYLWPAMWNSAFNEDDPLNPKLADEYGIVMGTTHHEPMLRAQQEWKRHGTGPWDYSRNAAELQEFWKAGIERNKRYESIITVGMRGDGDLPMTEESNVALLEKIVAEQRKILAAEMNPDLSQVPQLWALYKEVQEYYEKGMRVPDDVTLLWCDDNWGNIRRLPTEQERKRAGGAGIYYHFDYVGDPRSYKWINTNPIPKVWEQMHLAYEYGATRIWIVNVGDLKPMEFPMEFFLTYAWNPQRWSQDTLGEYTQMWAEREFGKEYAGEIAALVAGYGKLNGRRKPELIDAGTYSQVNFREADAVAGEFHALVEQAEAVSRKLPAESRDAYFQLVLFPVKASAQVAQLYLAVGKNHLYAEQGRAATNDVAAEARALFQADAELSAKYNHELAGGKWNHMMDQSHIGYTAWNDPPQNVLPELKELEIPAEGKLGVAVERSAAAWPGSAGEAVLPTFDGVARQSFYVDVFNRGRHAFSFQASTSAPWIVLSESAGRIEKDKRVFVTIDWAKAPIGNVGGEVKMSASTGESVVVKVRIVNPEQSVTSGISGYVESNGYVSIEAEHFAANVAAGAVHWGIVPDYGRTLSGVTIFPATAASVAPPVNSPHLEYPVYLFTAGKVEVQAILGPSLNFVPGRGLRYAVSIDEQALVIVDALANHSKSDWETSVKDSVRVGKSTHTIGAPGRHTLKIWMVDPGVVLEKVVLDFGALPPSYLGPPESFRGRGSLEIE